MMNYLFVALPILGLVLVGIAIAIVVTLVKGVFFDRGPDGEES